MAKRKKAEVPTLREFLDGRALEYRGYKQRMICAYQIGIGVILQSMQGKVIGKVSAVDDDIAAKRLYWNLTRKPIHGKED